MIASTCSTLDLTACPSSSPTVAHMLNSRSQVVKMLDQAVKLSKLFWPMVTMFQLRGWKISVFENREGVLCQHNVTATDGPDEWGSPSSNYNQAESHQITTNCRLGENYLAQDNSHCNGDRHPEDRASSTSLSVPRTRKRFTASDEHHVSQVQPEIQQPTLHLDGTTELPTLIGSSPL